MIQKLKSMKANKKGFTLAELLIVVAILAVLAAIALPVFTAQLDTAKEKVDQANANNAASMALADWMLHQDESAYILADDSDKVYYTTSVDEDGNVKITHSAGTTAPTPPDSSVTGLSNAHKDGKLYVYVDKAGAHPVWTVNKTKS